MRLFFMVLMASFSFSCLGPHRNNDSVPQQMFDNSLRRDAAGHEARLVAHLDGGCTAFFVANSTNQGLMMTARHCVDNDPFAWCLKGGEIKLSSGEIGRCHEVIATDSHHDIFLFRSTLPYDEARGLRLARNAPATNTRLKMIGFPADSDLGDHVGRGGRLTVTENCWVLGSNFESPHYNPGLGQVNPLYLLRDVSALHNCSTYGGNSGGPMIVENTNVVIGQPYTYRPLDFARNEANNIVTSANLAQMSDFVATFPELLRVHGVAIVDNPTDPQNESTSGVVKPNPTKQNPGNVSVHNVYCHNGIDGAVPSERFLVTIVNNRKTMETHFLFSTPSVFHKEVSDLQLDDNQNTVHLKPDAHGVTYAIDFTQADAIVAKTEMNSGVTQSEYVCAWHY